MEMVMMLMLMMVMVRMMVMMVMVLVVTVITVVVMVVLMALYIQATWGIEDRLGTRTQVSSPALPVLDLPPLD